MTRHNDLIQPGAEPLTEDEAAGAAAGLLAHHEARRSDYRSAVHTPAGAVLAALIREHTAHHSAPELRKLASGGTQADLDRAAAEVVEATRDKAPDVKRELPHTILGARGAA